MKQKLLRVTAGVLAVLMLGGMMSGCGAGDKKDAAPISAEKLNDKAYTIGVAQGASGQIVVGEAFPQAEVKYYNRDADSYLAVQQGKIDAFLYDRVTMEFAIASGLEGVKLLPDNIGTPIEIAMGISPQSSIPNLQEKFNEFLAELRDDGTLDDMFRRWISQADDTMPEIPKPTNPELTIKVGTTGSVQPFSYYKGDQLTGYDIEMINRFASWMNAEVKIATYDFDGIVAAAQGGAIDCILSNLNITEERKQAIQFSDPIFESYNALLVKDGTASAVGAQTAATDKADETTRAGEYATLAQMAGKPIACITGGILDQLLGDKVPNPQFVYYNNCSDQLTALQNHKVEGALLDEPVAQLAMAQDDSLAVVPELVDEDRYGMVMLKGSPMTEVFNREISRLRDEGVLDELFDKWVNADENTKMPAQDYDAPNGTLRVACSVAFAPMCYAGSSGTPVGYEPELVSLVAKALGKKVELISVDFAGLIPMVQSGKADLAVGCMSITDARKESVDMTDSHRNGGVVMLIRKADEPVRLGEYTTLAQLSGKQFACTTGTIFDQMIMDVIPDAKFSYFNGASDELAALRSGKVEGMPTDDPVAQLFLAQNEDLAIVPERVAEDHYGMVLAKNSPLTAEFNREIGKLKAEGALEELFDKWLNADEQTKLPDTNYDAPNGTLRVACSVALEPMCYAGSAGTPRGFEVELAMMVAKALGKKVELISVDFAGLIPMVQSGKADVALGCISISDERKQSVDMTDPHRDGGIVIVVRKATEAAAGGGNFFVELKESFIRTFVTESRWKLVLNGLMVTVVLSIFSGLLGSVLGFGICMMRRSKNRIASVPAGILIRIIQGTPIVVLLMILYYIIFGQVDISAILVAILGFAINFGVYVSEMIRTGIDAVDKGQIEAAHALGFTKMRTFWKITFPQAARHFLPVFKGEFISMVKMTSVVGYIAIQDLTKVSDIIRSRTLEAFFPLIATAVLYFIVANVLTILLTRIEIKLDPKRRKRTVKGVVTQ